jgi:hypothetical protein
MRKLSMDLADMQVHQARLDASQARNEAAAAASISTITEEDAEAF